MAERSELKFDREGLIPAVVQDERTHQVLMLAYMNAESIRRTLESGDAWFWSRSRGELWHKGATSGNYQHMVRGQVDCDGDTVLLEVRPDGPACHTGAASCFFQPLEAPPPLGTADSAGEGRATSAILEELAQVIVERHATMPEGSYVAELLRAGMDRIAKKVGEEAVETIIAAKNGTRDEIVWEVADLWFHTLVLLEAAGAPIQDVWAELARRRR